MEAKAVRPVPLASRILAAMGVLTSLLTLAFFVFGWIRRGTGLGYFSWLAAAVLVGIPLGLLFIRRGCCVLAFRGKVSPVEFGSVVACGAALGLLGYYWGMRQFAAGDQGTVIDVGWRLINGQRPYIDFPCTVPPGFYLGAELAYRLFGVYWRSIVEFNSLWIFIWFAWTYALLRGVFENRLLAFWAALTCVAVTAVVDAFWWYNPITNASDALYAASVLAVFSAPRSPWRWISLCLSLFLAALMKPNVSGLVILGGSLSLFMYRPTRWLVLAASAIALLIWLLVIHIHGSTLQMVLGSYLSVGAKGASLERFLVDIIWPDRIVAFTLLFAAMAPWVAIARPRPSGSGPGWPLTIFALFCLLAGIDSFLINSDLKIDDIPLMLLSGLIIVAGRGQGGRLVLPLNWTKYATVLCIWLSCIGLFEGALRYRVHGGGDFFEFKEDTRPFNIAFFQGFHAGTSVHQLVDDIAALCATRDMTNAFFAERLQWAYAAYGLPSPKGMPLFWNAGAGFAAADEPAVIAGWVAHKFNPALFMDRADMPQEFLDAIPYRYSVQSEDTLDSPRLAPLRILVLRDQSHGSSPAWPADDMWLGRPGPAQLLELRRRMSQLNH